MIEIIIQLKPVITGIIKYLTNNIPKLNLKIKYYIKNSSTFIILVYIYLQQQLYLLYS